MSTMPYLLKNARCQRLQHGEMTDSLWEMLMDPVYKIMMGETAERLADKYGITRVEQDLIALRSHTNATRAIDNGRFQEEIIPVTVKGRKETVVVDTDEHPRRNITRESLAALKPVFRKDGTVTAGNASGLNDGAAVVVLSAKRATIGYHPGGSSPAGPGWNPI